MGEGALTKADLANHLSETVGLNKREAINLVEEFIAEICSTLEQGEEVKISGFGKLKLRDKVARPGRNPKTGESIPVSARRVVTFKASQRLKELVEKYKAKQEENT